MAVPKTYAKFVSNLKRLRAARGLTQEQLANAAGLNRVSLARLETGEMTNPSLDTLERLATALGVSVLDMLR